MLKIVTILGARPQFIKAAPICRSVNHLENVDEIIIHTGQHFDAEMSDIFFNELKIRKPKYSLGLGGGNHGEMTGLMLQKLEPILEFEQPDYVLVYGDTNSTLAGALSAAKLNIPVAHVEAGLRSYNKSMPEELNRVLVDHMSMILFTPTDGATQNLIAEGVKRKNIYQSGDVMIDALHCFTSLAEKLSNVIREHGLNGKEYILTTIHRAENTNNTKKLENIIGAFSELSRDIDVVLPIHPRTRKIIDQASIDLSNIKVINPVGYLDMLMLEKYSKAIATDSGGIQKEAFFHGVPCITLREETEWTELVDLGWNRLVSPESSGIANKILSAVNIKPEKSESPYGEGDAAEKIIRHIVDMV